MWECLSTLGSFILQAKEPVLNKVGNLSCVLACMHHACIHCLLLLTVAIHSPAAPRSYGLDFLAMMHCNQLLWIKINHFSLVLLLLGYFVTVDKLRKGMLKKHSAPELHSHPLEFWKRALLWNPGWSWTYSLSVSVLLSYAIRSVSHYDPLGICSFKRQFEVIFSTF